MSREKRIEITVRMPEFLTLEDFTRNLLDNRALISTIYNNQPPDSVMIEGYPELTISTSNDGEATTSGAQERITSITAMDGYKYTTGSIITCNILVKRKLTNTADKQGFFIPNWFTGVLILENFVKDLLHDKILIETVYQRGAPRKIYFESEDITITIKNDLTKSSMASAYQKMFGESKKHYYVKSIFLTKETSTTTDSCNIKYPRLIRPSSAHKVPTTLSTTPSKTYIKFKIQFGLLSVHIPLKVTANFNKLKQELDKHLKIPPSHQVINYVLPSSANDFTPFSELGLPRECEYILTVMKTEELN